MFDKNELEEMKFCINTTIASRQVYATQETIKTRLEDNKKFLEMDYKLLNKVIKMIESKNKEGEE